MIHHPPYLIFLQWLWLMTLLALGIYIAWDTGILMPMIITDTTRITFVIFALMIIALLLGGYFAYFLARQQQVLHKPALSSPITQYLTARALNNVNEGLLVEQLAEGLRGSHQVGWFMAGMLIKLGMLGTVIGFVMMLTSLDGLQSLDINQLQVLIQQMTKGMGIALNTTIFGLIGSMILGIQFLALDRYADHLIAATLKMAPIRIMGKD